MDLCPNGRLTYVHLDIVHFYGVDPTVVLAPLIGQFGLILWGETSDSAHFFLVRATEKTKTVLDQKIPQKNYRSGKC